MKRLLFLAVGMFAMGCDDYVFAGLLPNISASLHTSIAATAQGCAVFGIAYVMSIPLCAFLLARKPARLVLITALVVFIASNVMTLLSTGLMIYLTSRFVAGLGAGLFLPIAAAAGTQLVKPGSQGRALSVIWGSNSAGAVVGVPLGLWLTDKINWRATVALILILTLITLVGIAIRQPALQVSAPPSLVEQFHLLIDRRVLSVIGVTLLTATGSLGLYAYIAPMLSGTVISSEAALSFWNIGGLIGSIGIGYVVDRGGKPQLLMAAILIALSLVITVIPIFRSVPVLGLLPFLLWGTLSWATVAPQQCRLIALKSNHDTTLVALNTSAFSLGSVVGIALGGLALGGGLGAKTLPYAASLFLLCAFVWQMLSLQQQPQEEMST